MLFDRDVRRIAGKELTQFFSSPMAYLFLGSFVLVMLYLFFWVETFFARNIADVRPLFRWMPVMLVFLSAALTMRMWSEEHRSGTIEFVSTLPVRTSHFVLGKFYACLILLILALLLTLPIPITVSIISDLDWGPVFAAYLAAILLGAAYLSIGLYVSARSDSQIVSLIITVLVCGLFNLVGSPLFTGFFGNHAGEWLRLLGSGSRFESIERGIIDFRDLYYYVSIAALFIVLNSYTLEKQRWAKNSNKKMHARKWMVTALLVVNLVMANLWLYPLNYLRLDVTRGQMYSLSDTSRDYLSRLQEPILIRGYFSAKTHPLLAPLVPRIKDMLKEYEVVGRGTVHVEFVDPQQNPEMEDEANKRYGIKPVPLQITDKYQAALVNSYFNILIEYGDQYEVLGFRDLIEIKARSETDLDVRLRNPEYDITRAIKKVLYAYQSGGDLFSRISDELTVTAYISSDQRLPGILKKLKSDVGKLFGQYKQKANGKFRYKFVEPEANNGKMADTIYKRYGFKPMSASLLDKQTFYFYVVLSGKRQKIQIPLPSDYKIDEFRRGLEAGLKRFASGFLKKVGVVTPVSNPYLAQLGMGGATFRKLKTSLSANLTLENLDLKKSVVPSDIDLLLVIAPKDLSDREVFAIDQFVMQGGTLVIATSPFSAEIKRQKLIASRQNSGLAGWFENIGIDITESFVMDPVNTAFPVPVTRNVRGFSFQEIRMLDYPYFIDIRDGLNKENIITSGLDQLTMTWASPIKLDENLNKGRKITPLLTSSDKAWTASSLDIMPRIRKGGKKPFPPGKDQGSKLLGVIIEGQFNSFYADKQSPFLVEAVVKKDEPPGKNKTGDNGKKDEVISGVINRSPENARIILFSSNEFIEDETVSMITSARGTSYLNSFQLLANAIDWSLEDRGLLTIRSRGNFNQTIPPMEKNEQMMWEYINYAIAILGIVIIVLARRLISGRKRKFYQNKLDSGHCNAR